MTENAAEKAIAPWKPTEGWSWDRNTTHNARHLYPILLFARFVPRSINRLLALGLGSILAYAMRKTRQVVRHNVEMVAGTDNPALVRRTIRRTFQNYARYLVDFMELVLLRPSHVSRFVRHSRGRDVFDEILSRGQGGILVTPHLGHWELGGVLLASEGYPVNVAGFRGQDAWTDELRQSVRKRMGLKIVLFDGDEPTRFGSIPLIRALRQNEFIALLSDRDASARPCEVGFHRGRLRVSTGPAVLSYVTGAPLLPVYVVDEGRGRYVARSEDPIDPEEFRHLPRDEAVDALTRRMTGAFEKIVGENLTQWYNFFPDWVEDPDASDEGRNR
jgi:KDO2-lipid IV(A) lauroyltransferase